MYLKSVHAETPALFKKGSGFVRDFLVPEKVEVRTAIRHLGRPGKSLLGDRQHGDARRQRDPLLHAGEADVEAPLIEEERNAGQR